MLSAMGWFHRQRERMALARLATLEVRIALGSLEDLSIPETQPVASFSASVQVLWTRLSKKTSHTVYVRGADVGCQLLFTYCKP